MLETFEKSGYTFSVLHSVVKEKPRETLGLWPFWTGVKIICVCGLLNPYELYYLTEHQLRGFK